MYPDLMSLISSAIIPAAGRSERLGAGLPKQMMTLGDRPVLAWAAGALAAASGVSEIVVGAAEDQLERTRKMLAAWIETVPVKVVAGGAHRQDTVRRCLQASRSDSEIIVIHDAARPLLKKDLVEKVIGAAKKSGAATLAIRPADTIKLVNDEKNINLDRQSLWRIQTPQAFAADLIKKAHEQAAKDGFQGTDDTALVERLGHEVEMVVGHEWNLKITTKADWDMVTALVDQGLAGPEGKMP